MSSEIPIPLSSRQEDVPTSKVPSHQAQPTSEQRALRSDAVKRSVWWTIPALAIGIFLSAADQTLVVASYGKIGTEFASMNRTSWIATAYFLTMTAFQPLYGRISDLFGRKAALCSSFGLFALGCLWCGLSKSMTELIAARAFAGIGGGGMTTVVAIVLSDVVPLRDRGTWQGYNNIVFASGAGLGAPLGGAVADKMGWRWSFLLQVPIVLIAFLNVLLTLKEHRGGDRNWKTDIRRVDVLGAALLVAAISTLLFGLDKGSNDSWASPLAYGNVLASLVLFVLFLYNEAKTSAQAFAPLGLILARCILSCLLCNFFAFGAYLALTYDLPLYWQAVESLSATSAGVRLLPGIIANACGSLFAGWYMRRMRRYRLLTIFCYFTFLLGTIPIIVLTGQSQANFWGLCAGMILYGFGNGIGGTSTLVALIANTSPEDHAVGIACLYLFRSLGSGLGIGLSATVIQTSLRHYLISELHGLENAGIIAKKVRESLSYIDQLPDIEVQRQVRHAYSLAARNSFGIMAAFEAGALVAGLVMKEKKLDD